MPLLPIPNPVKGIVDAIGGGAADAVERMLGSLAKMVIEGAAAMFGQLIERINTSTTPNLQAAWFRDGPYAKMLAVATFLTAIMVVLGICQAVASGDPGGVARKVIVQLPGAVLGITMLIAITTLGIQLVDALSAELMQGTAAPAKEFVKMMTAGAAKNPQYGVTATGPMLMSAIFMLLGCLVVWVELLVRSALIYLLVALAPVAIAARVWGVTRDVSHRVVHYLAGFVLAKLIVALCLSIGLAALTGPADRPAAPAAPGTEVAAAAGSDDGALTPDDARSLGVILLGAALVGLAAFAPFTAIKLMPIAENAAQQQGLRGAPVRAVANAASTAMLAKSMAPRKGG